mmetsp:Transcript_33640/g.51879  ORF Transcript_33640/g.51879 Transcript_33640/m.51879 type:complete len:246 (-) Transcript_33640:2029-2766(-)
MAAAFAAVSGRVVGRFSGRRALPRLLGAHYFNELHLGGSSVVAHLRSLSGEVPALALASRRRVKGHLKAEELVLLAEHSLRGFPRRGQLYLGQLLIFECILDMDRNRVMRVGVVGVRIQVLGARGRYLSNLWSLPTGDLGSRILKGVVIPSGLVLLFLDETYAAGLEAIQWLRGEDILEGLLISLGNPDFFSRLPESKLLLRISILVCRMTLAGVGEVTMSIQLGLGSLGNFSRRERRHIGDILS